MSQIVEVSDTPLRRVIQSLGGWPVTDSAWDPDRAPELETMLAVIKRNFTLGVLIEEWVGPDDRNSQNHIIQIGMYWEAGRALEGLPAKIDHALKPTSPQIHNLSSSKAPK